MGISLSTFKSEIDRAFRVLGPEKGFDQNVTDIKEWRSNGYINDEEYKKLRQYNRATYHELP